MPRSARHRYRAASRSDDHACTACAVHDGLRRFPRFRLHRIASDAHLIRRDVSDGWILVTRGVLMLKHDRATGHLDALANDLPLGQGSGCVRPGCTRSA